MTLTDTYKALCAAADHLETQIERTCWDMDDVTEDRGAHGDEFIVPEIARLQTHLATLQAQLDGIRHVLIRDHHDDLQSDREEFEGRRNEERMLGNWD